MMDKELRDYQNKPCYTPTVTCFTPSLVGGTPFAISVHCWDLPDISHSLQPVGNLKHPVWEFRVFMDGINVGYQLASREGPWPLLINTSIGR